MVGRSWRAKIEADPLRPRQEIHIETNPERLWILRLLNVEMLTALWVVETNEERLHLVAPAIRVASVLPFKVEPVTDPEDNLLWRFVLGYAIGAVVGDGTMDPALQSVKHNLTTRLVRDGDVFRDLHGSPVLIPAISNPERALELSAEHIEEWMRSARNPSLSDPLPSDFDRHLSKLLERTENLRRLADAVAG